MDSADRIKATRMADCHPDRKHFAKGLCKSCYDKQYYRNNPEFRAKATARASQWRHQNPKRQKESDRRLYLNNQEARNQASKVWYTNNRERAHAYTTAYRRANRTRNWYRRLVYEGRESTKVKNLPAATITPEQVRGKYEVQNCHCFWTGLPMVPTAEPYNSFQPSLDRLDPSQGYTCENTVLCCWFINRARSNTDQNRFAEVIKTWEDHVRANQY